MDGTVVNSILNNPGIQWGFAFLALVIFVCGLWFVWWMTGKVFSVVKDNQTVVTNNTTALQSLIAKEDNTSVVLVRIEGKVDDHNDLLLSRPCLKDKSCPSG